MTDGKEYSVISKQGLPNLPVGVEGRCHRGVIRFTATFDEDSPTKAAIVSQIAEFL
jgi:hypothetical protein